MDINIQVKRKNVKNITLRIKSNGEISITAPYIVSEIYLKEFIKDKEEWISKKLLEIEEKNKNLIKKEYLDGEFILFLGKEYKIELNENTENSIKVENDKLIICCKDVNCFETKEKLINCWYKEMASDIFVSRVNKYVDILGEPVNRISIKKMKTRWGSCNHVKRYINLNLELIKQPIDFIEYVILHELAHLVHPNHSKVFWGYIEKYMPDYKNRKALIKY